MKKLLQLKYLLALVFLALCLWMTLQRIPVADLFWQLKSGQLIHQLRHIPGTDPFSYTAGNGAWINHEWLACLVFYAFCSAGGFALLYAFKSLVILLTYVIMAVAARRRTGGNLSAAVLAGIWMLLISGGTLYFDIRPYLFTYVLLALTLFILDEAYYGGKPKYLYALIPITLLWVNTHGGYILAYILQAIFLFSFLVINRYRGRAAALLGALFIGGAGAAVAIKATLVYLLSGIAFAAGGVFLVLKKDKEGESTNSGTPTETEFGSGRGIIPHAPVALVLSILAGFLNPYTYEIFLYPFTFLGDSFYKWHLIEWVPPRLLGQNLPFFISVLVILGLALIFRKRLRATDFLIIGMFSYLGLTVVRHGVLYSMAMVPVAAILLGCPGEHIPGHILEKLDNYRTAGKVALAVLFILVITLSAFIFVIPGQFQVGDDFFPGPYKINYRGLSMEWDLFPVAGKQFLELNPLPGRMYNPYEWGGYFIWNTYPRYKVFIDGRANTIYPEEVYKESLVSMAGARGWEKVLDKYDINFVFCNKYTEISDREELPSRLKESSDWFLLFEDEIEYIFIRNRRENAEIIETSRLGNLPLPLTPYRLNQSAIVFMRDGKIEPAENLLKRALEINPDYIPAYMNLGYTALMKKDYFKAEIMFFKVLSLSPRVLRVNFQLGRIFEETENPSRAAKFYRRELQIDPGFKPALERLDFVEKGIKR